MPGGTSMSPPEAETYSFVLGFEDFCVFVPPVVADMVRWLSEDRVTDPRIDVSVGEVNSVVW